MRYTLLLLPSCENVNSEREREREGESEGERERGEGKRGRERERERERERREGTEERFLAVSQAVTHARGRPWGKV